MCGFNPVDKYAVKCVQRILKLYPSVFRGIGELLLRHDDLTNLLYGQPPRADHSVLEAVYQLAGERGLPVLLHQDITGVGRDTPVYQDELARVLERFPETTLCMGALRVFKACRVARAWAVCKTSFGLLRQPLCGLLVAGFRHAHLSPRAAGQCVAGGN